MPKIYCADVTCVHNQEGNCQAQEVSYAFDKCQTQTKAVRSSIDTLTLNDLALGKCFRLTTSESIYKKISNHQILDNNDVGRANAIDLLDGQYTHIRTDIPIEYITDIPAEFDKEEDKVKFSDLPIGSRFRWVTTCGRKVADIKLPRDWVKHPKDFPANHINLDRNTACLMNPETLVIPLD